MTIRLLLMVAAAAGFAFALVPFYDLLSAEVQEISLSYILFLDERIRRPA